MENYEIINGVNAIQLAYYDSDYFNMTKMDDYNLLSYDSVYMYMHGERQVGDPDWNDDPIGLATFTPPIQIKRHMKIGDSYTSSSTYTDPLGNTGTFSITVTLLGIEDVTVDAGYFPDCLKVEYSFPDGNTDIEWMAKDVGTVKSIDEEHYELDKAMVKGKTYESRF